MGGPGLQPLDGPVSQLRVTAQFIQKVKENTSLRHEGMPTHKTRREESPPLPPIPGPIWLLFLHVFSPPSGPALCKLG